jgi:hypothetical protein
MLMLSNSYVMNETYEYLTDHKLNTLRYMFLSFKSVQKLYLRNMMLDPDVSILPKVEEINYTNVYYQLITKKMRTHECQNVKFEKNGVLEVPELNDVLCFDEIAPENQFGVVEKYLEIEKIFERLLDSNSAFPSLFSEEISYKNQRLSELLVKLNDYYITKTLYMKSDANLTDGFDAAEIKLRKWMLNDIFEGCNILNIMMI